MEKRRKNRLILIRLAILVLALGMLFGISGCSSVLPDFLKSTEKETVETTAEETSTYYDYQTISGVVTAIDTEEKTFVVLNIDTRESIFFTYGNGTMVKNKYDDNIAMAQIEIGEIVNVEYERLSGSVKELKISPDAWELDQITIFTMDRTNKTIQAGSYLYRYDSSIAIVSDGQLVEPTEISDQDELTIKGCGTTAYSIIISKGHGYVSLEHAEYFMGGVLTIGKIVKTITENMLVVVPEGDYTLEITNGLVKGSKPIRVTKNEELKVDVSSFVAEARQLGSVYFKIRPENAVLYINGIETSHKEVAQLEYGTYSIRVTAEGYTEYRETYQVNTSYQEKIIALEAKEGESSTVETEEKEEETEQKTVIVTLPPTESASDSTAENDTSSNTASQSQTSSDAVQSNTTTADNLESTAPNSEETTVGSPSSISSGDVSAYKIHITEPSQTEVYFDGEYIGTTPVSVTKVSGEHTIILKKDGYITKTYTVNITSDQIDSYYSFPALGTN